jgi:protein-tyrosine-phosphatase
MTQKRTILLVCTGNLCRSPMAVAVLRKLLQSNGREDNYNVRSAGTWTYGGSGPAALAAQAMEEMGLDISHHTSRHLNKDDVDQASLIIAMAREHKEAMGAEFPECSEKIFLLRELAGESGDVADPYGSDSLDLYRQCASEIGRLLRKAYPRVLELSGGHETDS